MSIPVALAALAEQTEVFGTTAYLVSVGPEGRPHVVAVTASWAGEVLVVPAGRTTTANIGRRPEVTLVWPAPPAAGYCLIVDGTATPAGEGEAATLLIRPGKAVLHRTPDGDPSDPSCITVLPRP